MITEYYQIVIKVTNSHKIKLSESNTGYDQINHLDIHQINTYEK